MNYRTILSLLLSCLVVAGCSEKEDLPVNPPPVPVKSAVAGKGCALSYIDTTGHVEAVKSVDITAQITGSLTKVYVREGSRVRKGDLLFLIDEKPYRAAVKHAEGALEESIADLLYAKRTLERNRALVEEEYIAREAFDALLTKVHKGEGMVKQRQADLEQAEINLGHTLIRSPIDGRAGEILIHEGNLITQDQTAPLIVIKEIDPVYVAFSVGEKDFERVRGSRADVQVLIRSSGSEGEYTGTLSFIDNRVDPSTGMIKCKALFRNEKHALWPDKYVKVRLILERIPDAVLIPSAALRKGMKGRYVYVIDEHLRALVRYVRTGQPQDDALTYVESGLQEGEKVVVDGQFNLSDKATVRIITETQRE
ncbi:MAG: efflux RND transporter periplasmic adaptor subunit [Simkaniaceae bacterium]|nr:efflux RND transporter periplasmic adaptor subunit [Simkaniaceae bacterium]